MSLWGIFFQKKEMSQSAYFVICGSLFVAQARKARKNSVELGSAQLASLSHRVGLRTSELRARFAQKSVCPSHSVGTANDQIESLRDISFTSSTTKGQMEKSNLLRDWYVWRDSAFFLSLIKSLVGAKSEENRSDIDREWNVGQPLVHGVTRNTSLEIRTESSIQRSSSWQPDVLWPIE